MSNSTYTGTPQWLQVPSTSAPAFGSSTLINNPGPNVTPGPFVFGNNYYWILTDFPYNSSGTHVISAYKGTMGQTQPFTRITSTFSAQSTVEPTCYWDGTSSNVNVTWVDNVITTGPGRHIYTALFNMNAGTFGTINDPATIINFTGGGPTQCFGIPTANGNLSLFWDEPFNNKIFAITSASGGSWGSVSTATTTGTQLLGAIPIANNNIGVWAGAVDVKPGKIIYYTYTSSFTAISTYIISSNYIQNFLPFPTLYDSVHDVVAISVMDNGNNSGNAAHLPIYTVTPSTSGTIGQTLLDSDPTIIYGWEGFALAANPSFTQFYGLVNQGLPVGVGALSQLFIYTATSLVGPWSSKSVFYTQDTQNSNPPGDCTNTLFNPLITPFYASVLPNGNLNVSMGFNDVSGNTELVVQPLGCPSISGSCPTTNTLYLGTAYTSTLTAIGGTAPYTWTVLS